MKHAAGKHGEFGTKVPWPFARPRRLSSPAVLTAGRLMPDSSKPPHRTAR